MNPLLKKLPKFRDTLTQEQRDTLDAMSPEQRTLFLAALARKMIIRELPQAGDTPPVAA